MANGIKVDEDTFATLTPEEQRRAMFQAIVRTNTNLTDQLKHCEPRFRKLEKRKWIDKGISVASGAIGGFLGVFGIKMS